MSVDLGFGVLLVTRAEWGARPPDRRFTMPVPSPRLWLHHTGDENHGAAGMRAIQNYHMDVKGWDDIAYSFLVDDDGTVYEGRGAGVVGGHTEGDNSESHAICGMGNYETRAPTAALLDSIRNLGAAGRDHGWWPASLTGGHRDAPGAQTACPGQHLYTQLPTLTFPEDDMPSAAEVAAAVAARPEFTALFWRVLGHQALTDPVDNHIGNPNEPNHAARALKSAGTLRIVRGSGATHYAVGAGVFIPIQGGSAGLAAGRKAKLYSPETIVVTDDELALIQTEAQATG